MSSFGQPNSKIYYKINIMLYYIKDILCHNLKLHSSFDIYMSFKFISGQKRAKCVNSGIVINKFMNPGQ